MPPLGCIAVQVRTQIPTSAFLEFTRGLELALLSTNWTDELGGNKLLASSTAFRGLVDCQECFAKTVVVHNLRPFFSKLLTRLHLIHALTC